MAIDALAGCVEGLWFQCLHGWTALHVVGQRYSPLTQMSLQNENAQQGSMVSLSKPAQPPALCLFHVFCLSQLLDMGGLCMMPAGLHDYLL